MPGLHNLRILGGLRSEKNMSTEAAGGKLEKVFQDHCVARKGKEMGTRVVPLTVNQTLGIMETGLPCDSPSQQGRSKQVTDPIGQSIKARLCQSQQYEHFGSNSGSSSGSEHEPNSVCLAAMVHNFIEDEAERKTCGRARCNCENGTSCDCSFMGSDDDEGCSGGELVRIIQGLSQCASTAERSLLADMNRAVRSAKEEDNICRDDVANCTGSCIRRAVMARLRHAGYNAAICKSRWDHSRGFPGGNYEYIDVISDTYHNQTRLLVDIDFKAQFQVARPTHQYSLALQTIPALFVGKAERIQQLVDLMTESAKRSLKRRGMHLPPWRKPEYMRAKWLAPYKRTINEVPSSGYNYGGCMERLKSGDFESVSIKGTGDVKLEGRGVESASIILDLELGPYVDAVIYKGKVFPMVDRTDVLKANFEKNEGKRLMPVAEETERKSCATEMRVQNLDWQLPSVQPKVLGAGGIVKKAGLASLLREASMLSEQVKVDHTRRVFIL
eukprot:jgi/Mesen1/3713/ME000202S02802